MKLTQAEKWEAIEAKLPKVERAATAARYDTHRKTLVLTLQSGAELAIPITTIRPLADATEDELAEVALEPDGLGLRWETLDVDLLVVGIVREATGEAATYRNVGRARTPAKAASARANGMNGGRPRTITIPLRKPAATKKKATAQKKVAKNV